MPFTKGHKLARGRGEGTKNKKTLEWETFSKYCLEGGLERFAAELNTLEGRDYVESFLKLLEFHKPKLARTELKTDDNRMMIIMDLKVSNPKFHELTTNPGSQESSDIEEGEIVPIKRGNKPT